MRRILIIVVLGCCIIPIAGCAFLKEGTKSFLGISTRGIENARSEAIVKIIDYKLQSCYQKVESRLKEIGSYIYAKDENMIAVYISKTDTTPAGVFFRQLDNGKTEVSIASAAKDTKEYLADKVFEKLDKI